MKKTSIILLGLVAAFAIGACSKGGGFRKTKSGLLYKVVSDNQNPLVQRGQFLKVHYTQKINDSLLNTSVGGLPTYARVDSIGPQYNPQEIFGMLRKGDSAVVMMIADSLQRRGGLPPFINKNDKLILTLKVLDVLNTEQEVKDDQAKLMEGKKSEESEFIEKYLTEKNINTEKTDKGVFVEIERKGDGPAADPGKSVHVMYTGRTFEGEVFDSNVDSAFGHTDPFVLVIGKGGAIEGWDDGLRLFNKGGKGRLYIPSLLAYGQNPPPGAPFKAFENLIFDVEVIDVTDPAPAGGPQKPPAPKKP